MSWFKTELNNDTKIFVLHLNGMLTAIVAVFFTFPSLSVGNGSLQPICQTNGEADSSVPFLKHGMKDEYQHHISKSSPTSKLMLRVIFQMQSYAAVPQATAGPAEDHFSCTL